MSGGVAGARAGTIALMFGGPTDVFESHRELLDAFAGNVFHVGQQAGHGQAMKLVNNVLSATALAATSEALALGESCGLDLATMLDVVNVSTGRNSATYDKFPNRVLTGTYDTGFFTRLMAKDVNLFNAVAEQLGTAHAVMDAIAATWNACDAAMPGSDFSEIWKFVPLTRPTPNGVSDHAVLPRDRSRRSERGAGEPGGAAGVQGVDFGAGELGMSSLTSYPMPSWMYARWR